MVVQWTAGHSATVAYIDVSGHHSAHCPAPYNKYNLLINLGALTHDWGVVWPRFEGTLSGIGDCSAGLN